jgi:hypothetical protein
VLAIEQRRSVAAFWFGFLEIGDFVPDDPAVFSLAAAEIDLTADPL